MDFEHADSTLEKIASDANENGPYSRDLARRYRKVLNLIATVANETELYSFKSLRFEKLRGKRCHERSLRLNQQWRLIVEVRPEATGNVIVIKGIEDYH